MQWVLLILLNVTIEIESINDLTEDYIIKYIESKRRKTKRSNYGYS